SPQAQQGSLVDLVPAEQIGVVSEVPQEPTELPQGPGCGVQPPGDRPAGVFVGFEDVQAQSKEGLLRMPSVESAVHPDQEEPFEIVVSILRCAVQTWDKTLHACTSWVWL